MGRTSYVLGLFRAMLHSTKSKSFSSINFSFDKSIRGPDLARGPQFGGPAIDEIEVNDDDHYLFMWLRIGYCYV